jgi:hypothetical protein
MVVSPAVLEEYESVLHRVRLKLDPARVAAVMALIRKNALLHPTATAIAAKGENPTTVFWNAPARRITSSPATPSTFPGTLELSRVVTPRQFIDLILPALAAQYP